ncbi:phosphodiester glycosidase family protein [Rhodohalobacter halophilus]|uniref:phosphodiester glycosidase family protein n=1 Tax=Rhodohalobacter halophilus TaxID=1812810 RepID=UPI00083FC1D4|nr:phosphodiester glycosidase family protein [Rhodohalobacter halophilus]
MKTFRHSLLVLFILSAISLQDLHAQDRHPLPADTRSWSTEVISDGIYWETYHGDDLFGSTQSINVIRVDMNAAGVVPEFVWSDSILIKTSEFAETNGAVAAINGSFFDVQRGGSVVFFRVDGEILAQGAVNRRLYSENGGIGIDSNGSAYIVERPDGSWLATDAQTLLSSGPLLILDGETRSFNNDPFNQNRHPRTAVGITENDHLLLVTVDGRSGEAHGMSIPELAELMASLGAHSALNLDGGGSTTMWLQDYGVVSFPSDNGQFDHSGERGVANALLLIPVN